MKRTCAIADLDFEITSEDEVFYNNVSPKIGGIEYSIPLPTLSPSAREQRRLTWRNERTLYRRKCSKTGQDIISIYSPEAPFPVYGLGVWFSDTWDPMSYGREFDFSRTFFEQFALLLEQVPQYALHQQQENENCPYTHLVTRNKNCHYIFAANDNENAFYGTYLHRCRDVSDCFFAFDCELCYECIDCSKCYQLRYSQECENCSNSDYLLGCVSCRFCFGCVSLVRAEYCIFNQQHSASEYATIVSQLRSRGDVSEFVGKKLTELQKTTPRKFYSGVRNENFSGDHLLNCRNVSQCFDVTGLEDCKYCTWLHNSKDCYDCYAWGLGGELGLENHLCGNNFYRCLFCMECWNNVSDLLYCRSCHSGCAQLFGCVGLSKKKNCILNKQYSAEDYERMVGKIIEHMKDTREWGEFFPSRLSPFGYNETVAAEYYPQSREDVLKRGWRWRDLPLPGTFGKETVGKIEDLVNIDIGIVDEVLACRTSGKNYRITRAEFELYKKLEVLIPVNCFDVRYESRRKKRNPRVLRKRGCDKCGQEFLTAFPQDYPGQLFCESCYQNYAF